MDGDRAARIPLLPHELDDGQIEVAAELLRVSCSRFYDYFSGFIWIQTYGCRAKFLDERLRTLLVARAGHHGISTVRGAVDEPLLCGCLLATALWGLCANDKLTKSILLRINDER